MRRCRTCGRRTWRPRRGGIWGPLCRRCDARRHRIEVSIGRDGSWNPVDAEWLLDPGGDH